MRGWVNNVWVCRLMGFISLTVDDVIVLSLKCFVSVPFSICFSVEFSFNLRFFEARRGLSIAETAVEVAGDPLATCPTGCLPPPRLAVPTPTP